MILFTQILIFLLLGLLFVFMNITLSRLLQWRLKSTEKSMTYECGEDAEGTSWIQFNNRFYVIALIFLIFDVEVVFLFPWAVVFKDLGWAAFAAIMIFLGILALDFAYLWIKGDLDWIFPSKTKDSIHG